VLRRQHTRVLRRRWVDCHVELFQKKSSPNPPRVGCTPAKDMVPHQCSKARCCLARPGCGACRLRVLASRDALCGWLHILSPHRQVAPRRQQVSERLRIVFFMRPWGSRKPDVRQDWECWPVWGAPQCGRAHRFPWKPCHMTDALHEIRQASNGPRSMDFPVCLSGCTTLNLHSRCLYYCYAAYASSFECSMCFLLATVTICAPNSAAYERSFIASVNDVRFSQI
jgi:hypothetical protein